MTVEQEYQRQVELAEWIDDNFKIELPADEKSLIAIGCFDITIEHHAAICVLIKAGIYASLFALLRSIFESCARGLFVNYSATDKEINLFKKDSLKIEFKELVSRIEQSIDANRSVLSQLHKSSWKIFNSFTHTGFQHITRRHKHGITGSVNYPEQEIIQALKSSGSLALISAGELAVLSGKQDLVNATLDKMLDYAKH